MPRAQRIHQHQQSRERRSSRSRGKPTIPMCLSTVLILLLLPGTSSLLPISFSTARTTPSLQRKPIAVPPFSTALVAYSTCRTSTFHPAIHTGSSQSGVVSYLEVSAIRTEDGVGEIVTCADGGLLWMLATRGASLRPVGCGATLMMCWRHGMEQSSLP